MLEKFVFCCVDKEEGTGVGHGDIQEVGDHSLGRMLASLCSKEKALKSPLEMLRVYGPKSERLLPYVWDMGIPLLWALGMVRW